ncbi:hypothetical protein ACRRN9_004013 [Pseudomonas aeruginosa]
MNKANECTCPSGDGSLVHPCPAHPAVEQAGGDERAADAKPCATRCPDCGEHDLMPGDLCACGYETDPATGYACSECDGSGEGCVGEVCRECDGSGWFVTPDQARAALAQPSPAQAEQAEGAHVPDEVFAGVFSEWWEEEGQYCRAGGGDYERTFAFQAWRHLYPLLLQARAALAQPSPAQAEAERPEVVGYRSKESGMVYEQDYGLKNPEALTTVAECERIVGALRADRDSWAEQAEQRLADWDEMRKERDAALARVAELEACGAPALLAAADYFAERAKGPSPGWVTLSAVAKELRVRADKAPVAQAQQLHDLDKQCRDDVARALGLRPNQERGFAWSYLLASIKSCVKASGDSAQAQHSVPAYVSYTTQPAESLAGIALRQLKDESRWVEIRDINAHAFPDMRSHSYYPAGTVIKLPAAAPGKEVGHE